MNQLMAASKQLATSIGIISEKMNILEASTKSYNGINAGSYARNNRHC